MKREFELICAQLLEMDAALCGPVDFDAICIEQGVDPRRMDNMFYETFGMSGEEVVCSICRAEGCKNFCGMLVL